MSRVLVTGATGFIGVHLVRRLRDAGAEVVCFVRRTSHRASLKPFDVEFIEGDVSDADSIAKAVEGCEAVYHVAGMTSALTKAELHRVNAEGTRNVAAACAKQASPPVLVHVSSIAASGPSALDRPHANGAVCAPISHYGRSKLAGERALGEFADRVPITIVRPPIVFGQGDRSSLPLFASVQRFGIHMSPLWRSPPFSFIHADDLAAALLAAAQSGTRLRATEQVAVLVAAGANGNAHNARDFKETPETARDGVYFASADEIVTYAEFGRRIGRTLGLRRTAVIPNAASSVWLAALGSEVVARLRRKPMIFNLDKAREALAGAWTCSSESLKRDTDWRPAKSLDERLAETAQWYQEQGWLPKPGLLGRLARR
jgi:nucleoside-diphosphate-sugar epimerase